MSNEANEMLCATPVSDAQPTDRLATPEVVELPVDNIKVSEFCDRSACDDDLDGLATEACQGAERWISVDVEYLWKFGDDDINEDPRLKILRTSICGVRAGSSCPS